MFKYVQCIAVSILPMLFFQIYINFSLSLKNSDAYDVYLQARTSIYLFESDMSRTITIDDVCIFLMWGCLLTCLIYQSWKISKQFYHSSSKLIVNLFTSKNNFIKIAWCNLASRKAAPKHYLKGRLKGER